MTLPLPPHDVRRVAVQAHCDPRTVERYLRGARQCSTTQARVGEALRACGLGPPGAGDAALRALLAQPPDTVPGTTGTVAFRKGVVEPPSSPTARALGKALRGSGVRARVKAGVVTLTAPAARRKAAEAGESAARWEATAARADTLAAGVDPTVVRPKELKGAARGARQAARRARGEAERLREGEGPWE